MSTCFLLNSVRDTGTNGYSDCYITRHSLAQILVMFAFESFVTCLEEYFVNCWHYEAVLSRGGGGGGGPAFRSNFHISLW